MFRFAVLLSIAWLLPAPHLAVAAPDKSCVFTVSMTSGTDVNNLDFVVNYANSDSIIEGTTTRPLCVNALNGRAFAAFHDDEAGHLSVATIRLTHFSAPVDLAACEILYDSSAPDPGLFSVQVSNAGRDGDDNNVDPTPTVVVTRVDCPGTLPTPTTTTTTEEPTTTTTTLPSSGGRCGFPNSGGTTPTASDALFALKAAVGASNCNLCVCDVNSSGAVGASDALAILRTAVGIDTALDCPAC
ncbi:MAG TPA: hypothetical protein VGK20_12070 [Candidatus Binatia bacterium]|jgi:hypothetical protein